MIHENVAGGRLGPDSPELAHLAGFEGKVKGALVRSVLDNYAHRYPGVLDLVSEHLAGGYQQLWDEGVVASAWYPEAFFVAVLRAIDRAVGLPPADEEITQARDVFGEVMRLYHKMFLRVMGAERVLQTMAGSGWGLYHTEGGMTLDVLVDHHAEGRLHGNPALLERPYAEGTLGGLLGFMELAGAKQPVGRIERLPPDVIRFEIDWE